MHSRLAPKWIRYVLVAALICLLAAAFYVGSLIRTQRHIIGEVSQFNIAVNASELAVTVSRTLHALSSLQVTPDQAHQEDAEVRLEILHGRAKMSIEGNFGAFVAQDERRAEIVAQFRDTMDRVTDVQKTIAEPALLNTLVHDLERLEPAIIGLVAEANSYSADEVATQQGRLVALYQDMGLFCAGLVLFAFGFVLLGWRQSRRVEAIGVELRTQNTRFEAALDHMSQGLCLYDQNCNLVIANNRFGELFKLSPEMLKAGTSLDDMLRASNRGDCATNMTDEELVESRRRMANLTEPASTIREQADGRVFWVSMQPVLGGGFVITFDDMTERRLAQARIAYLAMHDAMTDLPNRIMFREKLDEALDMLRRGHSLSDDQSFAVHLIDVDNFKAINDIYGHPIGDAYLGEIARRLKDVVRRKDIVARLGGDEFVILQTALSSPEDAARLCARVTTALGETVHIDGLSLGCGVSIGVASAPDDGLDADLLLKRADLALYRAKANGKGSFSFFDKGMDEDLEAKRAMELDLRLAVERCELIVHYQPLVNVITGAISGFEALVRWKHPVRGLVPPLDFIPLAEETGLINSIGEWVLREACCEAASWPDHLKISVNISPVQVKNRNLVHVVVGALATSNLAPNRLDLEITESIFLQENEQTLSSLRQLRELGVLFSIDDFGTGYSSLSSLRRFPFDKLKIDRSFVKDVVTRQDSIEIIHAVISLGRSLGISTTAEGVETEAQMDILRAEGCTEVQGYMFGRPMPASDLEPYLRRSQKMIAA